MNNFTAIVIVSWESRSWRHRDRAVLLCRNYGLKPVMRNACAGKLYARERKALLKEFQMLFAKPTERFSFATICRTCFESSCFSATLEEDMAKGIDQGPAFEIIQVGQDHPGTPKKS